MPSISFITENINKLLEKEAEMEKDWGDLRRGLVGRRVLIKEAISSYSPIEEVRILEVSPNEEYVKVKNLLRDKVEWIRVEKYVLLDKLD